MTSWLRQKNFKTHYKTEWLPIAFFKRVSLQYSTTTFLKRKFSLHSLYFSQNMLMLSEPRRAPVSSLHSIFRVGALRYQDFLLFFHYTEIIIWILQCTRVHMVQYPHSSLTVITTFRILPQKINTVRSRRKVPLHFLTIMMMMLTITITITVY